MEYFFGNKKRMKSILVYFDLYYYISTFRPCARDFVNLSVSRSANNIFKFVARITATMSSNSYRVLCQSYESARSRNTKCTTGCRTRPICADALSIAPCTGGWYCMTSSFAYDAPFWLFPVRHPTTHFCDPGFVLCLAGFALVPFRLSLGS